MSSKGVNVTTRLQLEELVSKLSHHAKRASRLLAEAEETPAAASAAPEPEATPAVTDAKVTVKTVIDQLNAIRGGRSFADEPVTNELTRYFDGLEPGEQSALHAYLKGIAQIVSGQVEAGSAEEPKDHGVATKATGKANRTVKPNVVRQKPSPAKAAEVPVARVAAAPKEDTTPPAPIIPKKR